MRFQSELAWHVVLRVGDVTAHSGIIFAQVLTTIFRGGLYSTTIARRIYRD